MKINVKIIILVQLEFVLFIFFLSCSTVKVDRVRTIEQAFNINNIDNALSHYTDNVVFDVDVLKGSGKQALRDGAEWDSVVNTRLAFSDVKINGDSVVCKCTDENDLSKMLGVSKGFYDPVTFVFNDGLIQNVKFERTSESRNASAAAFSPLIKWASGEKSTRLKELMPDGKIVLSAESANGWMELAREWREVQESGTIEKKKVITDQWLKLWNNIEISIAEEIFTKDFASHIPQFPEVKDLVSYKNEIERTPTDIQDFHSEINDLLGKGNKIAARFSAEGTWIGKIGEKQIDPVNYTNTWIVIFRFEGNKIAEEWWQFDNLGVMQQLGLIPTTKEGPPAMMRSEPKDFVWSEPSGKTGDPGTPAENKSIVMSEYEAWNQRNIDTLNNVIDRVYSPDFVFHDPAHPHVTDLESYKKWAVDECLIPFPDLSLVVQDLFVDGNKVAVRWTFTGTHKALGNKVTQDGISIYRLADGKIVETWSECDMLGTVQQLMAAISEKK